MDHKVVVVMVPFIAHGHLNQLIHLSNIVSMYNIPVHFICTASNLAQVRTRLDSLATNHINFHEFTTPPFASPPPDPSNAFPAHLQSSFESTLHLRHPVRDLVTLLSKTIARVVVIHDTLMSYVVQDVVVIGNVETYNFRPLSAFYYFWDFWEKLGRPFEVDEMVYKKLPSKDGIVTPEFKAFAKLQYPHMNNDVGDLFDSSRVVEGEYIEYLEREEISGKKKIWAIGPVNPIQIESDVTKTCHECLRWLDEQSKNSSMSMGVPMATWPMHSDQPRNAALITEVLGIGVVVKDWEHRDELVRDVVVKEAVEKLMSSKEGDEMRKSAAVLGDSIKKSRMEGGVNGLSCLPLINHYEDNESVPPPLPDDRYNHSPLPHDNHSCCRLPACPPSSWPNNESRI
ncbi:UDP-glucuronosyl/UDP-glucosyltransferase [Artemisia annua]|uniref:UDP-glucuronosyl/UDP-glucosyltransferase n=1 Tax=Artemisia annua TaxID=35608 RepID=A0A2U1QEI7_ARTAN|nr:UDP-glucuronosyl/UDP-glucosyltransferase [Artemisia annua]